MHEAFTMMDLIVASWDDKHDDNHVMVDFDVTIDIIHMTKYMTIDSSHTNAF